MLSFVAKMTPQGNGKAGPVSPEPHLLPLHLGVRSLPKAGL